MNQQTSVREEDTNSCFFGIFNECFPPIMDGVAIAAHNYAYWLQVKTGNACVVTPKHPLQSNKELYPIFSYSSIPIPFRKPYRFGMPGIDFQFKSRLQKTQFSLVHAHCPFSSGKLALKIAKEQQIPLVGTFHSKYRMNFERIIPSQYIVDKIIQDIVQFYEMCDEVWVPQAAVSETLREYGYKGHITVVENGNDFVPDTYTANFREEARARLNINPNETILLFVGQHIWEKNISFLLKSLALIKEEPFHMIFVGSGYAAKEIKKMSDHLGLTQKVTFVGQMNNRDQIKDYYSSADLFLFPSLYDNAPLVVREAAAMQTPSLLLAGSTSAEIIKDEVNGYLALNDLSSYAEKLKRLIHQRDSLHEVGIEASRSIARPWSDVMDEVLDRYRLLIKKK